MTPTVRDLDADLHHLTITKNIAANNGGGLLFDVDLFGFDENLPVNTALARVAADIGNNRGRQRDRGQRWRHRASAARGL